MRERLSVRQGYHTVNLKQWHYLNLKGTDFQGTDDFDFLASYVDDTLLTRNTLYQGIQGCIGKAIAREIFEYNDTQKSLRILINLKNHADDAHAISITKYADNPNYLEFVDVNRGIFLLPLDAKKVEEFLSQYLEQAIYETHAFSKAQVESYVKVSGLELSPTSKAVKHFSLIRRKSFEERIQKEIEQDSEKKTSLLSRFA